MQLVKINNPFQRQDRDISIIPYENQTIEDILKEYLSESGISITDAENIISVSINGLVIPPEFWDTTKPREDEQIVFMPIIHGGGDGGKQILNLAVMIAIVVATSGLGIGLIGAASSTVLSTVAGLAIIAGTGMLLQALTPAPQPKGFNVDDWSASQTFSWNPVTTQKQGIVKPKFYGRNKLYGNVIAVHTEIDANDDAKQTIKILVGLGEGPVLGIVADTIKINDQPLDNYTNITTEEKLGTLNQTVVSFFTETKPEYKSNRIVTNSGSAIIYTTPNADFDNLEIELLFSRGLYFANDQGGISNNSVGIKIEISVADAAVWFTLAEETLTDDTTSPKRKVYETDVTYTGGSPVTIVNGDSYDIRVTKTTADKDITRYGDELRIGSIREILEDEFTYPKTAILAIEALATNQLSGSLSISCIQDGAIVNVYDGFTWSLEFSDNPAWVLFDILTQPVIIGDGESASPYAIDRYIGIDPANIDIVKFLELSVFCDVLVDDGKDGTEKRITFNGGFDIATSPWEAALKVCEIARCIPIWTGSDLTIAIDKAGDYIQIFNVSNQKENSFKEIFMPQSELVSEIEIQYRDIDQDYKRVPFTILNDNIPNVNRRVTLELFGVTKQSEAWRAGMHRLAQNQYLKSSIEFEADIDSINSTMGSRILVQHDVPEWGEGGRVISGTTLSIVVDKDMEYISGAVHEVIVRKADDAINERITTSKYNDITGVSQGSQQFEIANNFANEYLSGDTIRVADSTGNDGIYTLATGGVFGGGITTLTVVEVISDGTVDGGLYNLRRIVVSSVFKNALDVTEAPEALDLYTFGVQNLQARKYTIINLRKSSDQYIKITAVVYNPLVYSPDDDVPIITPQEGITPPQSDTKEIIVLEPSWGDVERRYPPSVSIGPPTLDVPQVTNVVFSNDIPNLQVTWSEGILSYKGAVFTIAAGSSGTNKYIYWDNNSNPTTLRSSNIQADGVGQDKFILCVNNLGTSFVIGIGLPYWGELLSVETLSALTAQLGDVLAGTLVGTIITGGLYRTATSGQRIELTSDGMRLLSAAPASGKIGTTANGGDNIVIGTTGNGGDNVIIGSGQFARIFDASSRKIIETVSEQNVAEINYFNRSNTPSGPAIVGDTCVVLGVQHNCTVAGTPGTWVATGSQS